MAETGRGDEGLGAWNAELAGRSARGRVEWAVGEFGEKLVMSTSFGVQSAVLLHLATEVWKEIPVVWVDTGYLFAETYQFAEALTERLGLNLKVYQPRMTAARQEALWGKRWEGGLDGLAEYNRMNKVEPMARALRELGAEAWMSGLRREQAESRKGREFVEKQKATWKVSPLADWTNRMVYGYLQEHDLPYHPLWEKGYVSVGDWHSSRPLEPGMREEETRFGGLKRECGLHEASGNVDFQI